MSLTLEMPVDESAPAYSAVPPDNSIADEAAKMVEGGEDEDSVTQIATQSPPVVDDVTQVAVRPAPAEPDDEPVADDSILYSLGRDPEPFPESALSPEEVAREAFARTLAEAESAYVELSLIRADIQDKLKAAKEVEKEALERIQDLNASGWQSFMRKEGDGAASENHAPVSEGDISQGGEVAAGDDNDSALADSSPRDWRTVSIDELGLEGKFIDKLKETGAGTIGGLEDLRTEIAAGRSKWPKGVGEKKIELITEKLLAWLSKHRDGAEFQERTAQSADGDDEEKQKFARLAEIWLAESRRSADAILPEPSSSATPEFSDVDVGEL